MSNREAPHDGHQSINDQMLEELQRKVHAYLAAKGSNSPLFSDSSESSSTTASTQSTPALTSQDLALSEGRRCMLGLPGSRAPTVPQQSSSETRTVQHHQGMSTPYPSQQRHYANDRAGGAGAFQQGPSRRMVQEDFLFPPISGASALSASRNMERHMEPTSSPILQAPPPLFPPTTRPAHLAARSSTSQNVADESVSQGVQWLDSFFNVQRNVPRTSNAETNHIGIHERRIELIELPRDIDVGLPSLDDVWMQRLERSLEQLHRETSISSSTQNQSRTNPGPRAREMMPDLDIEGPMDQSSNFASSGNYVGSSSRYVSNAVPAHRLTDTSFPTQHLNRVARPIAGPSGFYGGPVASGQPPPPQPYWQPSTSEQPMLPMNPDEPSSSHAQRPMKRRLYINCPTERLRYPVNVLTPPEVPDALLRRQALDRLIHPGSYERLPSVPNALNNQTFGAHDRSEPMQRIRSWLNEVHAKRSPADPVEPCEREIPRHARLDIPE